MQSRGEVHLTNLVGGWDAAKPYFVKIDPYLFVDWAEGFLHESLPNQDAKTVLSSVGLGVQAQGVHGWRGVLDWSYPLMDGPTTKQGDQRLLFQFSYDL